MLEDLRAVLDREKKRLALELQLGLAAATSDILEVGSGGAERGGVVVSGGPEPRGPTARFRNGAGAENQHHQSPAGSCLDSRAAGQAPVVDELRRDGQWGEGDIIRGFGPARESEAHFSTFR